MTPMRIMKKQPLRLKKMERLLTLADRKRMLIEAIQHCDEPAMIAALEAALIQAAAKELED